MISGRTGAGLSLGLGCISAASAGVGVLLWDLPSLVLVSVFGAAVFLDLRHRGAEAAALLAGLHRALWAAGLSGSVISLAQAGYAQPHPSEVGPAIAVGLLPLLYALVAAEGVVGPLADQRRLRERSNPTG